MRDEHVGAFAVGGGILLLLLKYAALSSLDGPRALVLAPMLGRWAMVLAIIYFPYARPAGLGHEMKQAASWREARWATVFTLVLAILIGGWKGLGVCLAVALATWLLARLALRRINGLTGDSYGSICEITESFVLLFLTAGGRT
jgi:adenosylcobinamide-GDP ribazoletransferase